MFGPEFFALSGKAPVELGEGYGCQCEICGGEVSAPHRFQGSVVWCLYCGMERGRVPLVEVCGGLEFSFGITAEECRMISGWIDAGHDVDAQLRRRDEDLGHVLFSIG